MSPKISAYILAGGKSKRMGEDKGLMTIHGKPVIRYVIEEILKVTEDISIVTSNEKYKQFDLKILEDIYKEKGPAAGIDTALQGAKNELIFITSCDMPFISEKSILALISHTQQHEITVPGDQKFIEPMFAIYKKQCKEKWRALLLNGTLKLSDYFSHFDTNFVNTTKFTNTNPHLFSNLNTPQDLLNAAAWMTK